MATTKNSNTFTVFTSSRGQTDRDEFENEDDNQMHVEPGFGQPGRHNNVKKTGNVQVHQSTDINSVKLPVVKSVNKKDAVGNSKVNPFNQRRTTTNDNDPAGRKNTSGTLNRHESQSQLTNFDNNDSHEVELKAQRDENSQLFQDSLMQANTNTMNRFQPLDSQAFTFIGTGSQIQNNLPAQIQRITVNLEEAAHQEEKLSSILENLRNNKNVSVFCDDWWDLTENNNFVTTIANQIIKDPILKEAIIISQKYQVISIGIVQFYHLLAYDQTTIDTQTSVNTYLKNLMYYIHQNFLVCIQITLSRILDRTRQYTSWEMKLLEIVQLKAIKKLKSHSETLQLIKVHCSNQENIIRNIARANQSKKLFKVINDWMNQINRVPVQRIREMLYNIEQFRGDALKLPEIKAKGNQQDHPNNTGFSISAKADGGPVYGAGAKSAGSINNASDGKPKPASNQGQTQLTGKNPFAILKASAIAGVQNAVFPNNFANLPKAYPPFLGPLQVGKKYCLVLDLDETLIHNVEYGSESYFMVRPGCVQFIETMAKYYEIVIFTAALQEYADQVIDQIDAGQNIKYRLYRQHTSQNGPFLVKDLSLLGRELDKTIIIDNISDNFIIQPDNGIFISTWYDDMTDRFLEEITPLLIQIVEKQVPDVRKALRQYRDQLLRQVVNGHNKPTIQFQ